MCLFFFKKRACHNLVPATDAADITVKHIVKLSSLLVLRTSAMTKRHDDDSNNHHRAYNAKNDTNDDWGLGLVIIATTGSMMRDSSSRIPRKGSTRHVGDIPIVCAVYCLNRLRVITKSDDASIVAIEVTRLVAAGDDRVLSILKKLIMVAGGGGGGANVQEALDIINQPILGAGVGEHRYVCVGDGSRGGCCRGSFCSSSGWNGNRCICRCWSVREGIGSCGSHISAGGGCEVGEGGGGR